MNAPIGILLSNLGTPDAPTPQALRRYLKEFLWDPRVVDLPRPLWWLLLNGIILNTRPRKSAALYQRIWTEAGSPLRVITARQAELFRENLPAALSGPDIYIEVGMRYGNPSIATALQNLRAKGCRRILVFPLYPQYSAATIGSTFDAIATELSTWRVVPELRTIHGYYNHPHYIDALAASVRQFRHSHGTPDTLLISFHGLPKRYIELGDPYRAQCEETASLLVTALGLQESEWVLSYQSRFGKEDWLRPYTDETLRILASQEKANRNVHVICPGFSADCLETLQEINIENRHVFMESGGTHYAYIPALNDTDAHLHSLTTIAMQHLQGWR